MQDYSNSSFQLDLPPHLKWCGIHNVFHTSLLRIHMPSDDWLFPGQMDIQLNKSDNSDGEWAVDCILSHAGSQMNALFKIKWKSSDVTWLLYYQITYLHTLTIYFNLLGITQISQLPKGLGKPPSDNPQIFVGSIVPVISASSFLSLSLPHSIATYLRQLPFSFLKSTILSIFQTPFVSPTIDLNYSITMPGLRGISHPAFSHLSATSYLQEHLFSNPSHWPGG